MSNLIFEEPPADALSKDERASSGLGLDIGRIERELKAAPNQWAKVYGTKDVAPATKSVAARWDKKPGFETRRTLVESSKVDANGKKRPPSAYRYNIWVRFTAEDVTEVPDVPREVSIPRPQSTPSLPAPPQPVTHAPVIPSAPQAPDAEPLPPARAERYERPDPISTGMASFE